MKSPELQTPPSINLKNTPGLTSAQAEQCLRQDGPNRVEAERRHPLLTFLGKFWAPVPVDARSDRRA